MPIFLFNEFLLDLRGHDEKGFAKRVLLKLVDANGSFLAYSDDHHFEGITDGWIRVISRGHTAYRVVYIRRGAAVYLYRAGEHSIEDHLSAPASFESATPVVEADAALKDVLEQGSRTTEPSRAIRYPPHGRPAERFITNSKPVLLRHLILSRRLTPHKEIFLISPYISFGLFRPFSEFGKMIVDFIEDGAKVNLFTLPPTTETISGYADLARLGIELFFHEGLHAKLYIFDIDSSKVDWRRHPAENLALIGSANLTESGFALQGKDYNEELCYRLPEESFSSALEFAVYLSIKAVDYQGYVDRYGRGKL